MKVLARVPPIAYFGIEGIRTFPLWGMCGIESKTF